MHIQLEGNGISLELTVIGDGAAESRLIQLHGGEWRLKRGNGDGGTWLGQGRVGLENIIARAIRETAHAAGIAEL